MGRTQLRYFLIFLFFFATVNCNDDLCKIKTSFGEVDLNKLRISNNDGGYIVKDPLQASTKFVINFCGNTRFVCADSNGFHPAVKIHDDGHDQYCVEYLGSGDDVLLEEYDDGVILEYQGGQVIGNHVNRAKILVECDKDKDTIEKTEITFEGAPMEENFMVFTFHVKTSIACPESTYFLPLGHFGFGGVIIVCVILFCCCYYCCGSLLLKIAFRKKGMYFVPHWGMIKSFCVYNDKFRCLFLDSCCIFCDGGRYCYDSMRGNVKEVKYTEPDVGYGSLFGDE